MFKEGDAADAAFVVLAGQCAVIEGDERIDVLQPRALFGEIGALSSGTRSATVVALDPIDLLVLSLAQLREGFAASPAADPRARTRVPAH